MGGNHSEVLKNIRKTHEKLTGLIVNASLTKRMKSYLSTLLETHFHYCDIAIKTDGTREYVCKADNDLLRIIIQGDELLVFSDSQKDIIARYVLPDIKEKKEPEEKFSFYLKNNQELYASLEMIKNELDLYPDKLFYLLVSWGEWKEPVHFKWPDWQKAMREIFNAHTSYDYQIHCDFSSGDNIVIGRSDSVKHEIWISVAGSKKFIKRIKNIFQQ